MSIVGQGSQVMVDKLVILLRYVFRSWSSIRCARPSRKEKKQKMRVRGEMRELENIVED
jgi:hypothetical protein